MVSQPEQEGKEPQPSVGPVISLDKEARNYKAAEAGKALLEEASITPLTSVERKTTTRWELLCYYLYYFGNTGIGPWNYAPTQLQNILFQAGFDPDVMPYGQVACDAGSCYLKFAGVDKPIASVVLDISGISFAVQVVVSLIIGAYADYGSWRPLICIVSSAISWALGFSWLAVKSGAEWQAAAGLFICGYVLFNCSTSYFLAAMPGLVRDLPIVKESEQAVLEGRKAPEDHVQLDMVERNRIADYAFLWTSYGPVVQLAIAAGILIGINASFDTASNTNAINVIIAYTTGESAFCCALLFDGADRPRHLDCLRYPVVHIRTEKSRSTTPTRGFILDHWLD